MSDSWNIFPATIGEDHAWITYNHGYADIAEEDPRYAFVRIRGAFRVKTESGMPANEESPALDAVDDSLNEKIGGLGGVYVGRVTVGGHRSFYYYMDASEDEVAAARAAVTESSGYRVEYVHALDPAKKHYWEELYPTDDDWQVIQDLKVLRSLADEGDATDKEREVMHWAYFPTQQQCDEFSAWAEGQGYKIDFSGKGEDGEDYLAKCSQVGSMRLGDITGHTISSNRKARELGGSYDGWETSIERQ